MNAKFVWLLAAVALLISCSPSRTVLGGESYLDQNWGRSYEAAKFNQIANPDAGKDLEPVYGLDGVAAGNAATKYQESFKGKNEKEVINILKLQ